MKNICKFCSRTFKQEKTLFSHVCEKKRRWQNKEERSSVIGFESWKKFIKNTIRIKKEYKFEDFINSKLYIDFIKFGNFIYTHKIKDHERYIDYLLDNNVELKKWYNERLFDEYQTYYIYKENIDSGIEKSLQTVNDWSIEHEKKIVDFFEEVNTNLFIHYVKTAKISPWFLYLFPGFDKLFGKLNEKQLEHIDNIISPVKWKIKLSDKKDQAKFYQNLFEDIVKNEKSEKST